MKLNQTIGIIGLALAVSVGVNAAMVNTNAVAIKVSTAGLDLNSQRGQEVLYSRLKNAAKQVCGSSRVSEVGSVARALSNKSCYKEKLSKAVHEVGLSLDEVIETS